MKHAINSYLHVPPCYQNCQAEVDDLNTVVGKGWDGSILRHEITGCDITVAITVDNHGRVEKV